MRQFDLRDTVQKAAVTGGEGPLTKALRFIET